jgi:hypothetical protein
MNMTMNDDTWIELFIIELRLRRVPGHAIGDAVASVRELVEDSGQSAEEAFGPARAYAASLDVPVMGAGERGMRTVLLPVLGLFAFIVFSLAASALFAGDLILLSVAQILVLCVPLVLTLLFAFPFYPRAVMRQRWLPVLLVLAAGAAGAVSALLAPSSAEEAWAVMPALPVLLIAAGVLVSLSVVASVSTMRSADADEIGDPRGGGGAASGQRGRRMFLVFVDWLFPLLALVMLGVTWGLNALGR